MGSWSVTQWLKFVILAVAVIVAADYVGNPNNKAQSNGSTPNDFSGKVRGSPEFSGEIVNVVDGDTLDVLVANALLRVRLDGIDCPEKNQAFGQSARTFTIDMSLHKIVTVLVKGKGKYGRTLGEVVLADGHILNRELVKAGMAWQYKRFSKDRTLEALESEAHSKRVGLWADSDPVAPWDYRAHIAVH